MPYVLRNRETNEIYTCTLINNYDLPYYGTKYWDNHEEAVQERDSFLAAAQVISLPLWDIHEVEEHQVKLFNVKLKNNPQRKLFLDAEGRTSITELPTT